MLNKRSFKVFLVFLLLYTLHVTHYTNIASCADKGNPPVAHWRVDEGGGPTAYDESANNNDGTLYNHTKFVPGKIGKALSFDGTDDYVGFSTVPLTAIDNWTLEAWINPSNLSQMGIAVSNGPDNGTSTYNGYAFGVGNGSGSPGNKLQGLLPGVAFLDSGYTFPSANQWYHVVMLRASGTIKFYVNGTQTSNTFNNVPVTPTAFYIGSQTGIRYFNGLIDDVRVYNYARTADQILVDYNNGAASRIGAGTDPNEGTLPVAYWPLNENTGTTAYDRSGNGNNGTITNAAWAPGKDSPALSFDGSGDYINAGTGGNIITGALTIEAWIYPTVVGGNYRAIVQKRDGSGTQYEFYLYTSNGALSYYNGTQYISSYIPLLNKWTHVAVVNNSDLNSNLKLYADGVEVYSNAGVTIPSFPTAALYIGSIYTGGETFSGKIDDVKIYDYARTPAQIAYDYNKGKPVAHYKFDEGGGKVAYNEFGNIQPNNIPNLKFWLKADAITGLSDGSSVSTWSDSSGNGINFTQPTGSRQPVYKVNIINGCPVLRLAAASQQTMTNSTTFTNPVTVIYLSRETGGTNGRLLTALNNNWLMGYWGGARQQAYFEGWVSSSGTPAADTNWHIYSSVQTGSLSTLYEDGVQIASNANGVAAPNGLCLSGYLGSSEFTDGDIAEVIMYNSALSTDDRMSVENYLKNKYMSANASGYGILVGDTKFVDGKIGKAVDLDGTDDYVDVAGFTIGGILTVEAWVYNRNVYANWARVMDFGNGTPSDNLLIANYGTTGRLAADGFTGTSEAMVITDDVFPQNTWVHVACIFNGGNSKIYWNGQLKKTGTTSTLNNVLRTNCFIGRSNWAADPYFNGMMDDFRIYNYERTADQVMQDYNAGFVSRIGAPSAGTADPWGGAMPVAWWKLDENTGALAQDTSGNGNNGTLTNGPVWVPGKNGPALSFDGNDDKINITDTTGSVLDITGNLTIECRIYSTLNDGTNYRLFINKDNHHELGLTPAGVVFWAMSNNWNFNLTGYTLPLSQWVHLAFVYDQSTVKLYANGVQVYSANQSGALTPNDNPLVLGWRLSGDKPLSGKLDDVKIYNYARTQAQVAWDYNGAKPVGHWRFNEATSGAVSTSAGAIKDDSGNYNGTASATTFSYAAGKYGGALNFDGNDYVSIGSLGSFPTTGSLSFWVNATGMANYRNPFTTKRAGGNAGIRFEENASGNFGAVIGNDGGTFLSHAYISSGMQTSRWYHVTLVWDTSANNVKGYLDGIQVFNDSHTLWPTTLPDLAVGTGFSNDAERQWYGLVDDVRIYNYVRTADQILQDYNNGASSRLGD
ncbi:MAG: LamG domain-containing protein [Candidatus Omnitrophica bacterium]|nr:LamG domain-containing protein [Candidatus Omnitrophota bacterium]